MLPEASQARKAIWDAVDPHKGIKRIDAAFPKELRKTTRNSDMYIEFLNGSSWQVVGSDNFNSLVGSPPVGIVFSEWALANPMAWAILRPILKENGGWALFITTARGRNHAYTMHRYAETSDDWHAGTIPATDTDVFTETDLSEELAEYVSLYGKEIGTGMFEQEYLCSFDAAIIGAYYGSEMRQAWADNRVTSVPYDANYGVITSWDLGVRDSTVIIYYQEIGSQIRVIDCDAYIGTGLPEMIKDVKAKPYNYVQHKAPFDIDVQELGTGVTRIQVAQNNGIQFDIAPKIPVQDGISAVRTMLKRCVFDKEKCETLVEALAQYKVKWDQEKRAVSKTPEHDWCSDYADSFRYYAVCPSNTGYSGDLDYSNYG